MTATTEIAAETDGYWEKPCFDKEWGDRESWHSVTVWNNSQIAQCIEQARKDAPDHREGFDGALLDELIDCGWRLLERRDSGPGCSFTHPATITVGRFQTSLQIFGGLDI